METKINLSHYTIMREISGEVVYNNHPCNLFLPYNLVRRSVYYSKMVFIKNIKI